MTVYKIVLVIGVEMQQKIVIVNMYSYLVLAIQMQMEVIIGLKMNAVGVERDVEIIIN